MVLYNRRTESTQRIIFVQLLLSGAKSLLQRCIQP